jgi:hypothetical protein
MAEFWGAPVSTAVRDVGIALEELKHPPTTPASV